MASLDAVTWNRLRVALRALSRHKPLVAAWLFGSRASGHSDEWSDYDLAVFIEGAGTLDFPEAARLCAAIQKEAGDDIELHLFSAEQACAPEPASFAAYVMAHGIRLPLEDLPA